MKRGSVVLFRQAGSPASKSRPCVVVQRDVTLPGAAKITAVPLSSELIGVPHRRPVLVATPLNGLRSICEAQVDWIYSFDVSRLGPEIGEVGPEIMRQIDLALRTWLDL